MAPSFTALDKPQRAEAAGLTLTVGLLSLKVDGVPQRRPNSRNEAGTKFVCPDSHVDDDGNPVTDMFRVTEEFVCQHPAGHRHTRSELARARELDDGRLVPVADEQRAEALTGGLAEKELALTPVPAADLEAWTRPDDSGLRVRLPKKSATLDRALYRVLLELASDRDVALVGPMVISGKRRFWRLTVWAGQLFLESRIETADLAPPDELDLPELNEALVAKAWELRDALTVPFNPDDFRHDARAAIDELAAAVAEAGGGPVAAAPAATSSVENLLGALDDMLAAKRAEKAGPKKKAAKKPATKAG